MSGIKFVENKEEQSFRNSWRVLCHLWARYPGLTELPEEEFISVVPSICAGEFRSFRSHLSSLDVRGCVTAARDRGWAVRVRFLHAAVGAVIPRYVMPAKPVGGRMTSGWRARLRAMQGENRQEVGDIEVPLSEARSTLNYIAALRR